MMMHRLLGILTGTALLLMSLIPSLAFNCGAPGEYCGSSIPAGTTCPKGPGYCVPGFYCSYGNTTANPSRCLPVPKNCGKVGNPCCPSNAVTAHATTTDLFVKKPYCSDGSFCLYFAPIQGLNNGDPYAGIQGYQPCAAVPQNTGNPGKPCFPNTYKVATNPANNWQGLLCKGKGWCDQSKSTRGVCRQNAPNCGQFGKSCCINTYPVATSFTCGPGFGKGYCVGPKGEQWIKVPYSSLVCKQCPATDVVKANPQYYMGCSY